MVTPTLHQNMVLELDWVDQRAWLEATLTPSRSLWDWFWTTAKMEIYFGGSTNEWLQGFTSVCVCERVILVHHMLCRPKIKLFYNVLASISVKTFYSVYC